MGGIVAALCGMAILHAMRQGLSWTALPDWAVVKYLVVGALLAVAARVRLLESMLKRDAGVKDSGTIFLAMAACWTAATAFCWQPPALSVVDAVTPEVFHPMYEEAAQAIVEYQARLKSLRACLNVDSAKDRIDVLEAQMSTPGFWDDPDAAQKIVQELKALKNAVTAPDTLERELRDAADFIEMASEEGDEALGEEIEGAREALDRRLHALEMASLFTDPRSSPRW